MLCAHQNQIRKLSRMNIPKPITLLTIIIFIILSRPLFAQNLEPKIRTLEPDHKITSELMGRDYQLYISFPGGYTTKDSISYPVLYVLDGLFSYDKFSSAQRSMSSGRELKDFIIVGVGSGSDMSSWFVNRSYDYTPSIDTLYNRSMEEQFRLPKGFIKSGGADKFLEVLKTEIIPFVDKNYKTNTDRGISGHSLGGLFAAHCLLHSDGYFTRFGINSPSLLWNNEELLNQITKKNSNNWDLLPTKIFISVGALESSDMVTAAVKLSAYLKDLESEKMYLEKYIFENETHFSVELANMSRTLSVLYGRK